MGKKAGNSAKFGRGSRTPSGKAYRAASRWITNKAKAVKRHNRKAAKHQIKLIERQAPSSRNYERLVQLRNIVSQNMTG